MDFTVIRPVIMLIFVAILRSGSGQLVKISNCTCIGDILTYKCAVTGPGFTIWRGNAFDCPSSENSISLRHSSYTDSNGAMGQCNDGLITGHSLGVNDNTYTSELNITVSSDLIGRSVECVHMNMESNTVDSSTIEITDPPPRPSDFQLVNVTPGRLMFNWSQVDSNCSTLQYNVMPLNCSTCTCATPVRDTFTTCSVDMTLTSASSSSQFSVQTVICSDIRENISTQISVTLRVLKPPEIRAVVPTYSAEGKLRSVEVNFTDVDSFYIADGINGSALFYNVNFTGALMDVECDSLNIPASRCIQGNCTASSTRNLMSCSQSENIIISISASNRLGEGNAHQSTISNTVKRRGTNNIASIKFETSKKIVCTFLDQSNSENSSHSCDIAYGPCDEQLTMTTQGVRNSTSTIIINLPKEFLSTYCYVISASNGTFTIQIEGMSNDNQRGSNDGIIVGITVPVSVAVGLCLLHLLIAFIVLYVYEGHHQTVLDGTSDPVLPDADDPANPSRGGLPNTDGDPNPADYIDIQAHIIFELEEHPTHLLDALKILSDNQINIKDLKIRIDSESLRRKVYIECDENSGTEHILRIKKLPGLGLADTLKVHVPSETKQIQKPTGFDKSVEVPEILKHVPGALHAFLEALHTHCKYICEIDITHEDIPKREDYKSVTIRFVPTLPHEWKSLYDKDKSNEKYKGLIVSR